MHKSCICFGHQKLRRGWHLATKHLMSNLPLALLRHLCASPLFVLGHSKVKKGDVQVSSFAFMPHRKIRGKRFGRKGELAAQPPTPSHNINCIYLNRVFPPSSNLLNSFLYSYRSSTPASRLLSIDSFKLCGRSALSLACLLSLRGRPGCC